MIDAAHEAVWFDAYWAINSRSDFQRAVKAMIAAAQRTRRAGRIIEAAAQRLGFPLHLNLSWSPERKG
jgi:hypothetical protein